MIHIEYSKSSPAITYAPTIRSVNAKARAPMLMAAIVIIPAHTVVQIPPVCQKWPMSSVKLEGGKLGGKYPKKADAMRL